jgi:large subunit ribosomal protein L35Ae
MAGKTSAGESAGKDRVSAKPPKAKEKKSAARALILGYRRGRHTQTMNQLLLEVEGADSRAKASKYIGKRVVWTSPGDREIRGKITQPHGNSGVLRARFSKGLPGTAVGTKADILQN